MRRSIWLMAAALLMAAGAARAQGPGGGAPSPEMQQRMQRFAKFREQHKYTFQLRGTVNALGQLEQDNRCALTPDQARKVLAVLQPLTKQPQLTQEQAKAALKGIKVALSTRQLTEVGKLMARRQGPQGGRRQGGGGPGGGPGMGGPGGGPGGGGPGGGQQRPRMDPSAMKNFNPFAPPKADSPMGQRGYKRLQDTLGLLEKKAGKK